MKIIMYKLGLTILGMIMFMNASAFEPELAIAGRKKICLRLENHTGNTYLVVKEANGQYFYSENIEKSDNDYLKIFDLSILPDGNYVIELDGDLKVVSYKISIINNKIQINDFEKRETYKPVVVVRGKKVHVSKSNPENTTLEISIYNSNNDLVYKESFSNRHVLGKVFNFSNESGEFSIIMRCNNQVYSKIVSIN